MEFTIFLLPLLGGFLFLFSWYRARYFALRWQGYRLFFVSASVGFLLLALAFMVTQWLTGIAPGVVAWWETFVPDEQGYLGTCVTAFLMGPALAVAFLLADSGLMWLFQEQSFYKGPVQNVVFSQGDTFEQVLWVSTNQQKQVMLTTVSGKVYIGFATSTADPHSQRDYVRLMKMQSGYRDRETKKLTVTTDYGPIIEEISNNPDAFNGLVATDFNVVVPISEVATISIFDPSVYKMYQDGTPNLEWLRQPENGNA